MLLAVLAPLVAIAPDITIDTEGTQLFAVTLAGNRRAVYMISRTDGDDKPPARHRLWVHEKGTLRLVYDGLWGFERIKFSKHGTGRILESGVGACLRAQTEHHAFVNTVRKDRVLLRFDRAGSMLVEERRPSSETQDCNELDLPA